MTYSETFEVRISRELLDAIEVAASTQGISKAEFIRRSARMFLEVAPDTYVTCEFLSRLSGLTISAIVARLMTEGTQQENLRISRTLQNRG